MRHWVCVLCQVALIDSLSPSRVHRCAFRHPGPYLPFHAAPRAPRSFLFDLLHGSNGPRASGSQRRRVFTYSIDAGDKVYQAEEVGRRNAKAIRVDVNGPVDYRLDKDHLYIRDPDGKSHKLDLIKTTRKE